MYTQAQKIDIIAQVIKTNDDGKLSKIEAILNENINDKKAVKNRKKISDFVGILNNKESKELKKIIKESNEIIHEEDWK